ncbi:MAG: substrate-binding domain-containing protein [Pseudomonadota bacterium]
MLGAAVLMVSALVGPWAAVAEEAVEPASLTIQGSTTFHARLLQPFKGDIEAASGVKLSVIANKSIWGLMALLEGRTDLAMISASLAGEIEALKRIAPSLQVERLQEFEVSRTRVAFAVHPGNPVRRLPIETVKAILTGRIVNWSEVGGADLPIRVVATQDGGGTVVAVRSQLLGGAPIGAADAIRLESAKHVVKAVQQEPGAFGIAQMGLAQQGGVPELATDLVVEQPLSIVTLGAPSEAASRLIEAARAVTAGDTM